MPYLAPETPGQVRARLADTDYKEQATESSQLRNMLLGQENQRANQLRQVYQSGGQPTNSQIGQYKPELAIEQQQDNFENDIKKHNFIAGVSRAVLNRVEATGLQEGTPEYMEVFNKTMDAYKPQVAQVLGKPEILNTPNDLNAVKALASWDQQQGDLKNHIRIVYDQNGQALLVDTASDDGNVRPLSYNGEIVQGAQYSPELAGKKKQAEEQQRIINVTDPEGREFPIQAGEAVAPVSNNFGNLRKPGSKTEFQSFNSPQEGLAALDRQLEIFGKRDGIDTVEGLLNKYSPSNENNTAKLIANMQKRTGLKPGQKIDLTDPRQRHIIASNIMLQEEPVFRLGQTTKAKEQAQSEVKIAEDLAKEKNKQVLSQSDPVKVKAVQNADMLLDELEGKYEELLNLGGIVNPENSSSANLATSLKASPVGQYIGEKTGAKAASTRNSIESLISSMVPVIMKASATTGGQLNSESELRQFLKSLTRPDSDIKSVRDQLSVLRKMYGSQGKQSNTQAPSVTNQEPVVIKYDANGNRIK